MEFVLFRGSAHTCVPQPCMSSPGSVLPWQRCAELRPHSHRAAGARPPSPLHSRSHPPVSIHAAIWIKALRTPPFRAVFWVLLCPLPRIHQQWRTTEHRPLLGSTKRHFPVGQGHWSSLPAYELTPDLPNFLLKWKYRRRMAVQLGLQPEASFMLFPFFSTRLKAETDQRHYTELQEAQGQPITLLWKIILLFIKMMWLWLAQNGLGNTCARCAEHNSTAVLTWDIAVPFRKGNGLTSSRSASQTRAQPLPNLLVTKHPFMPILFLGSGMNLTHGFVILCSYRVGNEPQSELGSWNSQGAEPARTKSFNSFYTFQILFYVHAFFSPHPALYACFCLL